VLVKVLIKRRSRRLCHPVVRRTRAGERVTPTIGIMEETGSRQNRGVLVSLKALVGLLFRIGKIRPGSRPIMT